MNETLVRNKCSRIAVLANRGTSDSPSDTPSDSVRRLKCSDNGSHISKTSITYPPNKYRSRIPVLKSRLAQNKSKSKVCSDNKSATTEVSNDSSELGPAVRLRSVAGRSTAPIGRTQSEPIDCLKYILEIVRSDCSPEDKFKAIKKYRDIRLGISRMASFDGNKVNEWLDSGYLTNSHSDEVFANQPNFQPASDASKPMVRDLNLNSRRRSYNKMRAMELIAMNSKYNSFNSEVSMSSISSIESLLDSRREDPEELLLALGFGYQPENQTLNRIPQRFLESPSQARGVNLENVCKVLGVKESASMTSSPSFPSPGLSLFDPDYD